MREIIYEKSFEKDLKKANKKRKDLRKLNAVAKLLVSGSKLPGKYRDHPLEGDKKGYRELHIESNWLLMYKIDEENNTITFARLGSHDELFK